MNMNVDLRDLHRPIGYSDTIPFPDGKDIYLIVEQDDKGDICLPFQVLRHGGRATVLTDLMFGHYDRPVIVIRWKTNGTWRNVSSSFATFWFTKAVANDGYFSGTLPPFLDMYLHQELRPEWRVNEAA